MFSYTYFCKIFKSCGLKELIKTDGLTGLINFNEIDYNKEKVNEEVNNEIPIESFINLGKCMIENDIDNS